MRLYVKDYGYITTRDVILSGEGSFHASYMHKIPSFSAGVRTGMRLPIQNMVNQLISKYPQLEEAGTNKKTGLFVGSGASEWAGNSRTMLSAEPDFNSKIGFLGLINISAGSVAHRMGINDYLATDATACVSSLKCIQDAKLLIQDGVIDRAVILGWDDQTNSCVREVFGQLGASITKKEYEDGRKPSAFNDDGGGFLIGDGIGFMIIEPTPKDAIAEVLGISTQLHILSNPLTIFKEGYIKVMSAALKDADISEVHTIKAHGTGTSDNNEAERDAIMETCGTNNIVTSYKPLIGHTMGACGIIEFGMMLDDYKSGSITGIANKEHDSQYINEDTIPLGNNFLVNAAGMGGVYSTLVGKCLI
jgi:3-oxoacyl-[acyl-carrier-protein] synthase-1